MMGTQNRPGMTSQEAETPRSLPGRVQKLVAPPMGAQPCAFSKAGRSARVS
jgi:hypothetical protein